MANMKDNLEGESRLIQDWITHAHEALNDARLLFQWGRDNGGVANRAYYAMLYAVFALLVPYHVKKGVDLDHYAIALFDDKFVKTNLVSIDMSEKLHQSYDVCQAYDFQPFFQISK